MVSDLPPWTQGGLERHVGDLAFELRRRGTRCLIVAGSRTAEWRPGVITRPTSLSLLPRAFRDPDRPFHPPWPDPLFSSALMVIGRRWRPDVIHAHGWSAASAAVVAKLLRLPLVVTLHDYGFVCPTKTMLSQSDRVCPGPRSRSHGRCGLTIMGRTKSEALNLALPLYRRLIRDARLIAVSEPVRDAARTAMGRKALVIPNFVADELFSDVEEPYGGIPRVLFLGGDNPVKGLKVLEEAMVGLAAELVVAGAARGEERPSTSYLGVVERGQIPGLIDGANIVAVPSIWPEPCPTVAIEAMARSRTVIASGIGGIPSLLAGGAGRLVAPNEPAALRLAIEELAGSGAARRRLGVEAHTKARSRFSSSAVIPQIIATYAAGQ